MVTKSSKDTLINERFKAALKQRVNQLGKTQREAADKLDIDYRILHGFMNRGTSAAKMEEVASKLGIDLIDLLIEGRNILDDQPFG